MDQGVILPKSGRVVIQGSVGSDDGVLSTPKSWSLPLKGESQQCIASESEESCQWESTSVEIPTSGIVSVVDINSESDEEICQKYYQIPVCGN